MTSKKCKNLPKKGKLLHIGDAALGQNPSYEKAIALALRRELSSNHKTAKIFMRWTGAGDRTVRNWLGGIRGPNGAHLVSLMGKSNEVFRTVLVMAKRLPDPHTNELGAARMHAVELLKFLDGGLSEPNRETASDARKNGAQKDQETRPTV